MVEVEFSPTSVATAHGPADLSAVRVAIQRTLGERGVPEAVIGDAMLVATELVTNAFEHGAAPMVDVSVGMVDGHVVVETTHDDVADTVADLQSTASEAPSPTEMRGRGLLLVRALSTQFERMVDPAGRWRNRVGLALSD